MQTNPFDRSFNDPSRNNVTFSLGRGRARADHAARYCREGSRRLHRDVMASIEGSVALGVVAQGANCVVGDNGLGDSVGGPSTCIVDNGPPRDITIRFRRRFRCSIRRR